MIYENSSTCAPSACLPGRSLVQLAANNPKSYGGNDYAVSPFWTHELDGQ
jgi:hypothetical protein